MNIIFIWKEKHCPAVGI